MRHHTQYSLGLAALNETSYTVRLGTSSIEWDIIHSTAWDCSSIEWDIIHSTAWDCSSIEWDIIHSTAWDCITTNWEATHRVTWDCSSIDHIWIVEKFYTVWDCVDNLCGLLIIQNKRTLWGCAGNAVTLVYALAMATMFDVPVKWNNDSIRAGGHGWSWDNTHIWHTLKTRTFSTLLAAGWFSMNR